jgi:hypothetical protein
MRAKTILTLCCLLALLLPGAVLSAEPEPALTFPILDEAATAPVCAAEPVAGGKKPDGGPVVEAACPASVWQACFRRYGTCTLCYCLGASCFCENRCV